MCLPLTLELFQSLHLQAGLVMGAIRICPVPAQLEVPEQSCAYYPALPPVNVILYHLILLLPEAGAVLLKATQADAQLAHP